MLIQKSKKQFVISSVILLIFPILTLAQGGSISVPTDSPASAPDTGTGTTMPTESATARTVAPRPVATGTIATPTPINISVTPTPSSQITTSSPSSDGGLNSITLVTTALIAAGLIAGGVNLLRKNKKNGKKDDGRCDNIKALIEQKKKELEEMVKNWPKEKLQEIAKGKVLGELKKDEDIKKLIDTAESLKDKYDKLNKTIEMLEKRYDLCILSLPGTGGESYKGTIVENSLTDKGILENIKITKTYQDEDWILHDVTANEKQIEKMNQYINNGPWYMNFWQEKGDSAIVVFKDKNFKIKHSDKSTWTEAINYGKSIGIPEEQLNFLIK